MTDFLAPRQYSIHYDDCLSFKHNNSISNHGRTQLEPSISRPLLPSPPTSEPSIRSLSPTGQSTASVSDARQQQHRRRRRPSLVDDAEAEFPPLDSCSVREILYNRVSSVFPQECEADSEAAFLVCDLEMIYQQHQKWLHELPRVKPFFAVKCNPDPYVIRLLSALGAGFDCASKSEIELIRTYGLNTQTPEQLCHRIVYANACKTASFIRYAKNVHVDKMTFDNHDELRKIAQNFPEAKLILRILTDDSKSLCKLGLKFGAPLEAVPSLLKMARQLNLNVIGISFHVGSGCYDCEAFADAIWRARCAFDLAYKLGFSFSLLDIGGGFGHHDFDQSAAVLRRALDLHFPVDGSKDQGREIQVIAEPGRYYVSRAYTLAANIIARRAATMHGEATRSPLQKKLTSTNEVDHLETVAANDVDPVVMYYINDGVYGAFNCLLYDHQVVTPRVLYRQNHFLYDTSEPDPTTTTLASSVWGPTCDSIDLVSPMSYLPPLQVGDWLYFEEMGAYTICAASTFNGFPRSVVLHTDGGRPGMAQEIRRILALR